MLILTRRTGEIIKIGDNISITALACSDGQIKIGIDAPKEIAVHREEIYLRIQKEKKAEKEALKAHLSE